ncbi:UNKNOWN [Stylonychia lemnae]|uniref:Uncharacterized protein n=1 Tax=Stylonychia lemnae TaxID=5949 RepID=A0A078ANL4_STYLE|nr:UNKNOWN [Stylonychia lemnae]|eukprot:CDW83764.1 UNKNOWN [Stylonychia lemnae]
MPSQQNTMIINNNAHNLQDNRQHNITSQQDQSFHQNNPSRQDKYFNEDFQQVCKILNIDVTSLQQKSLQDFLNEDPNEAISKIRYEHYDKKRKVKLKQIQEFMNAMSRKSKSNLVTLSLIPKENLQQLKKSKIFLNHSYVMKDQEEAVNKIHRQRPRTHKNSISRDPSYHQNNYAYQSHNNLATLSSGNHQQTFKDQKQTNNYPNNSIFNLTNLDQGYQSNIELRKASNNNFDDQDPQSIAKKQELEYQRAMKNKLYFQNLPPEERQKIFRIKSAKKEKKMEKDMKQRKEEWEWRTQKRNKKIEEVLQKKKILEMEEEAKKQQKLDMYFEKTDKIQQQRLLAVMSSRESGGLHDDLFSQRESSTEREIQQKIMNFEEKMLRAALRKQEALERERDRINSQHQLLRQRRNNMITEYSQKEYGTLQRYCDRQSRSKRLLKKKYDEKSEFIEYKKQKEQEKSNQMRMRLDEQKAQYMSKVSEAYATYQHRRQIISQDRSTNENEVERKVKKQLKDQDQQDNMKRILITQKMYKDQLVQSLMDKERRYQGLQDYKRTLMVRSFILPNNSGTNFINNQINKSNHNISINAANNM